MYASQCILEIDLSIIRKNYRILSTICKNSEVGASVKANSYGLGAEMISAALQQENCQVFFVATIEEGIALRKTLNKSANIPILNGVFASEVAEFKEHNLIPILNNLGQVEIWQRFAAVKGELLPCILHIDTGMNRLGMPAKEVDRIIENPELLQGLELQCVMSHLSASEELENPCNYQQLTKFKHYLQYFPKVKASLANSSCIFLGRDYHFDLIRPGAALYGLNPLSNLSNPMLNPVKLTAPIIQIQELPSNSHISYNMTYTTNRNSIIATLPLGYADGYSRAFSNCGQVFIDGYIAPVIGRVSMDLVNIDVTDLPPEKIFLGQETEIIGNNCTPDKLAAIIGTIGYEILTKLGNRYKRIYK